MAEFAEAGIDFQAKNVSKFLDNITKINAQLDKFDKNIDNVVKSLTSFDKLSKSRTITGYAKKIETIATNFGNLSINLKDVNQAIELTDDRVRVTADRFETLDERQRKVAKSSKSMADNLGKADRKLRDFNNTANSGRIQALSGRFADARSSAFSFRDALGNTGTKVVDFGSNLRNAGDRIASIGAKFGALAIGGLAVATAALITFGVTALNSAIDFENAFASVTKVVDGLSTVNSDGIIELSEAGEALKDDLRDLSNEVPLLTTELSEIAALGGQLGITDGLEPDEVRNTLSSFAESIAQISVATDLTQESAATSLAQMSNIYQVETVDMADNIRNLGNAITALGNTSATQESLIVSFAQRVAGAGKTVGLSQADVLGLAAGYSELGIAAESGGTSVSRVLIELNNAINASESGFIDNTQAISEWENKLLEATAKLTTAEARAGTTADEILAQRDAWVEAGNSISDFGTQLGATEQFSLFQAASEVQDLNSELDRLRQTNGQAFNDEQLTEFLRIINQGNADLQLTTDTLQEAFNQDGASVFTQFLSGLTAEGDNVVNTLDALGLSGIRVQDALLRSAEASDDIQSAIAVANSEFEDGSALQDEAANKFATTENKLKILQNRITNTKEDLVDGFLPAIGQVVDKVGEAIVQIGERLPEAFDALGKKANEIATGLGLGDIFNFDVENLDFETFVNEQFDTFLQAIENFDTTAFVTNVTSLVDSFTTFSETISPVFTAISDNQETVNLFLDNMLKAGLVAVGVSVLAGALTAILSPLGLFAIVIAGISTAWANDWLSVKTTTISAIDDIQAAIDGLNTGEFNVNFEDVDLTEEQETSLNKLIDADYASATQAFDDLGVSLDTLGTNILNLFDSLGGGEGNSDETIVTRLSTTIDQLKVIFSVGFFDEAEAFIKDFQRTIDTINDIFENGFEADAFQFEDELFDNVSLFGEGENRSALGNAIDEWFEDGKQAIADNVEEFATEMGEIGASVIEGFLGPFDEDEHSWAVPLRAWIQSGIDDLKTFLGIESPSTVFKQFGIDTIQGFLDGINEKLTELSGILTNVDLGIPTIDTATLGTTLAAIPDAIKSLFQGILDTVDIGVPTVDLSGLGGNILTGSQSLKDTFEGLLDGTNLSGEDGFTLPSFEGLQNIPISFSFTAVEVQIDALVETVKNAFSNILSDIDLGFPTITDLVPEGVLNLLPEFDLNTDEIESDAEKVGQDVTDGLEKGIDDSEAGLLKTVTDLGSSLLDKFDETFRSQSPSEETREDGVDLIDGLALGLSEIGPVQNALEILQSTVLASFQELADVTISSTLPSLRLLDEAYTFFYVNTMPLVNEQLLQTFELKTQLGETNDELVTPSVNDLADSEDRLGGILEGLVNPALIVHSELLAQIDKDAVKLAKNIIKLTKEYEKLKKQVEAVAKAGGLPGPVVPDPSGSIPFADGGRFIVPNTIPSKIKGPTGGMNIEVHKGELVSIIPESIAKAVKALPERLTNSPKVRDANLSGAGLSNTIANTINNNNSNPQTFNLNVTEAVSGNVRDSFAMMQSLF